MRDFFSNRLISIAGGNTNNACPEHSLAKQKGITLLESLLALAIASAIIVLALKSYSSMQKNADIQSVNANVDFLFIAMSQYYRANCGPNGYDNTGTMISMGTLYHARLSPASYPINLSTGADNLVLDGFINLKNLAYSSFVDNSAGSNTGYFLQFNPSTALTSTFNNCSGSTPNSCNPAGSTPTGTTANSNVTGTNVLIWNAQVAVNIAQTGKTPAENTILMNAYKNALGADCISSIAAGVVTPCNASPTPGTYLVWTRLASNPSPQTTSPLWSFMPYVKQFQLQYTHDQFYELNNPAGGTYYYVCGG